MKNIKLKNLLSENMRRFGTKNLQEQTFARDDHQKIITKVAPYLSNVKPTEQSSGGRVWLNWNFSGKRCRGSYCSSTPVDVSLLMIGIDSDRREEGKVPMIIIPKIKSAQPKIMDWWKSRGYNGQDTVVYYKPAKSEKFVADLKAFFKEFKLT